MKNNIHFESCPFKTGEVMQGNNHEKYIIPLLLN